MDKIKKLLSHDKREDDNSAGDFSNKYKLTGEGSHFTDSSTAAPGSSDTAPTTHMPGAFEDDGATTASVASGVAGKPQAADPVDTSMLKSSEPAPAPIAATAPLAEHPSTSGAAFDPVDTGIPKSSGPTPATTTTTTTPLPEHTSTGGKTFDPVDTGVPKSSKPIPAATNEPLHTDSSMIGTAVTSGSATAPNEPAHKGDLYLPHATHTTLADSTLPQHEHDSERRAIAGSKANPMGAGPSGSTNQAAGLQTSTNTGTAAMNTGTDTTREFGAEADPLGQDSGRSFPLVGKSTQPSTTDSTQSYGPGQIGTYPAGATIAPEKTTSTIKDDLKRDTPLGASSSGIASGASPGTGPIPSETGNLTGSGPLASKTYTADETPVRTDHSKRDAALLGTGAGLGAVGGYEANEHLNETGTASEPSAFSSSTQPTTTQSTTGPVTRADPSPYDVSSKSTSKPDAALGPGTGGPAEFGTAGPIEPAPSVQDHADKFQSHPVRDTALAGGAGAVAGAAVGEGISEKEAQKIEKEQIKEQKAVEKEQVKEEKAQEKAVAKEQKEADKAAAKEQKALEKEHPKEEKKHRGILGIFKRDKSDKEGHKDELESMPSTETSKVPTREKELAAGAGVAGLGAGAAATATGSHSGELSTGTDTAAMGPGGSVSQAAAGDSAISSGSNIAGPAGTSKPGLEGSTMSGDTGQSGTPAGASNEPFKDSSHMGTTTGAAATAGVATGIGASQYPEHTPVTSQGPDSSALKTTATEAKPQGYANTPIGTGHDQGDAALKTTHSEAAPLEPRSMNTERDYVPPVTAASESKQAPITSQEPTPATTSMTTDTAPKYEQPVTSAPAAMNERKDVDPVTTSQKADLEPEPSMGTTGGSSSGLGPTTTHEAYGPSDPGRNKLHKDPPKKVLEQRGLGSSS